MRRHKSMSIHKRIQLLWLILVLGSLTACSYIQPDKSAKKNGTHSSAIQTANNVTPVAREQLAIIEALQKQLALDSKNPELHYNLALAHLAYYDNADHQLRTTREHKAAAIQLLREVLRILPGNVPSMKLLYKQVYDGIIQDLPHSFTLASGLYNDMPLEVRNSLNPPSIAVFIQRYRAQKEAGTTNNDELYRALLAAIHEQPAGDKAYIQLAKMYREENYFPLALATLKLGAEQISDSGDLYEAIANTYEARAEASGCNYETNAYLDHAIHFYQRAVPLRHESAELHYALARLYLDRNRYQLALHESSILVELEPTAENIAFSAQNYSMLGKEQTAHTLLEQARTKGLTASDSAYHEIYMNSGEWMKAALSFTDYLQAQKNISVYDAIKAEIIGQQADMDFSKLIPQKQLLFNSEWEAAVYAFWTNKMTRSQFEQTAKNSCERTEYFFYSGYRDYRAGKLSAARQNFSAALQQNTYRFIERPLARYFLSGLGAK